VSGTMKTRGEVVAEALRIKAEIEQLFTDAAHWNDNVRKPGEREIEADPDGSLAKTRAELELFLKVEREKWVDEAVEQIRLQHGDAATGCEPEPADREYAESLAESYYDDEPHEFTPAQAVRKDLEAGL